MDSPTYTVIYAQVANAVSAGGEELAEGIDIDAITTELVATYGLIHIDDTTEDGEPIIGHDTFWSLVRRYDATQV